VVNRWQQKDGVHLDLRGLFPPQPMVEILREIEGGCAGPLTVHMDRDPVLLYQELEDRGWSAELLSSREPPEPPAPLDVTASAEQAPVILVLKPEPNR